SLHYLTAEIYSLSLHDALPILKLSDRVNELIAAVIASAGQRPPRVYPAPRPQTAYTRLEAEARTARHEDLVAEVQEAQERYAARSEEHTSELQSRENLVCRLLL